MPDPTPNETREDYISRFMSSEEAQKDYPDDKQRLAVAYSKWKKHISKGKKEIGYLFSRVSGIEKKQLDDDLIVAGYIATTHLDSGWFDPEREIYVRDKLEKETLDSWADLINGGNPRTNKLSVLHNRVPHVAGVMIKGSAKVEILPDGEFGLFVETLPDKTREDYEEIKYRLENNFLDSFSIEFMTKDVGTGDYLENAVNEIETDWGIMRKLLPGTLLEGATYTSQPMNEHAIMIKDIRGVINNIEPCIKMEEKIMETEIKAVENTVTTPVETKQIEQKVETNQTDFIELKDKMFKEIREEIRKMEPEKRVMVNPSVMETKELIKFKEVMKYEYNASPESKMKYAGVLAEKAGLINETTVKKSVLPVESKALQGKYSFDTKQMGCKDIIEYKSLGITTNQNTDTDYLISAAELSDVFDPMIMAMINQATVTWNILRKDDFSNKGNNQVQFVGKIGTNGTATAYLGNAITTGQGSRLKFQTKFKKYSVGVEIDGDMIAAARGSPIGDVFALEVASSTADLLSVMNQDLFGILGAETVAQVIGLPYLANSATYTTLYNLTRSTTNKLSPAAAGDTYINGNSQIISLGNLRNAIRQPVVEGADVNNLVFLAHPLQVDLFKGIYDAAQKMVPTSSRFGFEGRPSFDGVPIFADKDIPTNMWFVIDLDTHRIGIWVPPTLEMLGKDADSQKGFIKCYWCTYNKAPRRVVMIYSNATS